MNHKDDLATKSHRLLSLLVHFATNHAKEKRGEDAKINGLCAGKAPLWLQQNTSLQFWQHLIGQDHAAEGSLSTTDVSLQGVDWGQKKARRG
jgi:hypothetical protein